MTFLDIKEQIKSAEDAEEMISNLNDPEWREANWIKDWEIELFKGIMKEEVLKAKLWGIHEQSILQKTGIIYAISLIRRWKSQNSISCRI